MFEAMLKMEISWFDDRANGTGSLCARLSGDAAAVQGVSNTNHAHTIGDISCIAFTYFRPRVNVLVLLYNHCPHSCWVSVSPCTMNGAWVF